MKKTMFALAAGLAATTAVYAATNLEALNAEITRIVAPFQNEATVARLAFTSIATNEERALSVGVNGLYRKVGAQNRLEVRISDISYNYGDGSAPTTRINAGVGIDLTKIMPQEQLNEMIPGVEQIVEEMSKGVTKQYGDAATIEAKVLEKTQDAAGNYVSIKAMIRGNIDLAKLPETMPVENVLVQSGELILTVNLKEGIDLEGFVVSNPRYKGFQRDQKGLKETLEQLLARDPKQLAEIERAFKWIDEAATKVTK